MGKGVLKRWDKRNDPPWEAGCLGFFQLQVLMAFGASGCLGPEGSAFSHTPHFLPHGI